MRLETFEAWGGGIFPHNHATKNRDGLEKILDRNKKLLNLIV
jgi:hypothetical protein